MFFHWKKNPLLFVLVREYEGHDILMKSGGQSFRFLTRLQWWRTKRTLRTKKVSQSSFIKMNKLPGSTSKVLSSQMSFLGLKFRSPKIKSSLMISNFDSFISASSWLIHRFPVSGVKLFFEFCSGNLFCHVLLLNFRLLTVGIFNNRDSNYLRVMGGVVFSINQQKCNFS